jgi:hypothetical protein
MKKITSLLALALAGLLVSSAPAQYLGSNDFSTDNIGSLSQYSITTNVGTYTVEQGRLEYSASLTASSRVLTMNGGVNAAYTNDWTASLSLTNLAAPTSGYNLIGMQVFSSNAEYGFFNIALYRTATGTSGVLFEKGKTTDGTVNTYSFTSYISAQSDFSDVLVRMSNNSTTKDVTLGYSLDGGATYIDTMTFNPTGGSGTSAGNWYAAPTDGYSFRILGRNTVDTIAGDLMFADNFSVVAGQTAMSAIPEPSTYAAFAGLGALGLAFWHRRRKATAVA